MVRYNHRQFEQIKDCLAVADMRHFTLQETCNYITEQTGLPMKYYTLAHMKPRLKQKMAGHIKDLIRDRDEYQYELDKAIKQKEDLIKVTWDLFTRTDNDFVQLNCIKTINDIQTERYHILMELTDLVVKTNVKTEQDKDNNNEVIGHYLGYNNSNEQPTDYDQSAIF